MLPLDQRVGDGLTCLRITTELLQHISADGDGRLVKWRCIPPAFDDAPKGLLASKPRLRSRGRRYPVRLAIVMVVHDLVDRATALAHVEPGDAAARLVKPGSRQIGGAHPRLGHSRFPRRVVGLALQEALPARLGARRSLACLPLCHGAGLSFKGSMRSITGNVSFRSASAPIGTQAPDARDAHRVGTHLATKPLQADRGGRGASCACQDGPSDPFSLTSDRDAGSSSRCAGPAWGLRDRWDCQRWGAVFIGEP